MYLQGSIRKLCKCCWNNYPKALSCSEITVREEKVKDYMLDCMMVYADILIKEMVISA